MKTLKTAKIRSTNLRLACLCLLVMTMTCLGGILFAQTGTTEPVQPTGTGIEAEPYLIGTLANLRWLSEVAVLVSPVYILQTADIDATETEIWNDEQGFSPIGGESGITAIYDGQDYTISGLNIYRASDQDLYIGLFGRLQANSTVKNTRLANIFFMGIATSYSTVYAGGIAGVLTTDIGEEATIENCFVSGEISALATTFHGCLVGGIVGEVFWNRGSVIIENCESFVDISAFTDGGLPDFANAQAGGIVGQINTADDGSVMIENSFSTGEIYSNGRAGGIAAYIYTDIIIRNSHSTGVIMADRSAGGIVGVAFGTIIENCFSTGMIGTTANNASVGGILGETNEASTIKNSYSTGTVTSSGNSSYTGGIAGQMWGPSELMNCYSIGNVSSFGTAGSRTGGIIGASYHTTISKSYSAGVVSSSNPQIPAGAIAGSLSDSTILDCVWDIDETGIAFANDYQAASFIINTTGYPTAQMKQIVTYTSHGFDFVEIWDINEEINDGYAHLRNMPGEVDIPLPPINLISIVDGAEVRLEWDVPLTQSLVLGYKVYRDDIALTEEPISELYFIDTVTENGTYIYKVLAIYENGESEPAIVEVVVSDVSETDDNIIGFRTILHSNYPNPFNPETTISFSVAVESNVSVDIYNIRGQKVRTLVNSNFSAGNHSVVWNGKDENGRKVGSGIYFYQMQTNDYVTTRKMVLMK
ncbi:MAG: T9SS type A sorting domain-containing protein [Candidatus Cloacimonetes bacterium]|nr:T9SS type A sorting domain-containing protein [Candidatus Cloacimonadota bacterium]